MQRRTFIKSCALAMGAWCIDHRLFAQMAPQLGDPKLRIGIVSDVHIRHAEHTEALEKTFRYFHDKGADGVIIAGDMADTGLERQLKAVATAWYRVFPKDKASDGRRVEKLFVYGNHDVEGHHYDLTGIVPKEEQEELIRKEAIANDRAAIWKKYFKEKYQPIYLKEVKGYKFVGAHWGDWQHIEGMPAFLEAHRAELEGEKPFFYIQHAHPRNTCYGPWAWGKDDGQSTAALSRFPNCIAFSGHSHTILQDDYSIWQGDFVSIGTSSLSYTYARGGRENTYVDGESKQTPYQMPVVDQQDGKQGLLMTVYDQCVVLERREFVYDEAVGPDWVLPLPLGRGEKPYSFAHRAAQAVAPEFPAGSAVRVERARGKDRYGTEQMQTSVYFPNVLCRNAKQRAYDFEVQLVMQDEDTEKVMLTKRVMSPHFYLGERKDDDEVVCVFGEQEIPAYRSFRFEVRPVECFGKKGHPISSEWMKV